jgi:hypothetical protein
LDERICFFISPIGKENDEIRQRVDKVLKHIVAPAVADCGFNCIRADQISEPGIITNQVIEHLLNDHLVIADLTGYNPNVFYELAIRHAARKPIIHLIDADGVLPFDVAGMRAIRIDHHDLDSAAHARESIREQATTAEDHQTETPFSVALELLNMRTSSDPERRKFGRILELLNQVQRGQEETLALLRNLRGSPGIAGIIGKSVAGIGRTRYILSIEDLQELLKDSGGKEDDAAREMVRADLTE